MPPPVSQKKDSTAGNSPVAQAAQWNIDQPAHDTMLALTDSQQGSTDIVNSVLGALDPDFATIHDAFTNKDPEDTHPQTVVDDILDHADKDLAAGQNQKNIYLQNLDSILDHARQNGLQPRAMVLDIDQTLLEWHEHLNQHTDEVSYTFYVKCPEAWLFRMAKERENDAANKTFTVWGIGTFRTASGLYHEDGTLRDEIDLLFNTFEDYINPNLVICTGDNGVDGYPGCKVRHILDWYHNEKRIPKKDIHIFDDQYHNVIEPALEAGYQATHIPEDELAAAEIIKGSRPSSPDRHAFFSKAAFAITPPTAANTQALPGTSDRSAFRKVVFSMG
jgi:FMN phosphatase YigB (HAD superfamily)